MSDTVTTHLRISGRVQGVAFRVSMAGMARQLKVKGWVRNCRDGSVEAMVQGAPKAVEDMIAWAHQGPPNAQVEKVVAEPGERGNFVGFHPRADA